MKRIAACAMFIWTTAAFDAKAELWTFVDARGVTHFASSQLDPRYASVSASHAKPPAGSGPAASVPPIASVSASPLALGTYFSGMPGFSEARHHLQAASEVFGVDVVLLQALVATESGFDAGAVSPKGAIGLMQVMPTTAARYGLSAESDEAALEKLKDPSVNVNMGTRYLRDLLTLFSGDRSLALAAYNAGEGAVKKAGNRIPDFKETQNYVKTVLQLVDGLGGGAGPARAPGMNSVVQTMGTPAPQPGRPLRGTHSGTNSGAGVEMITDRASRKSSVVSTAVPPKSAPKN